MHFTRKSRLIIILYHLFHLFHQQKNKSELLGGSCWWFTIHPASPYVTASNIREKRIKKNTNLDDLTTLTTSNLVEEPRHTYHGLPKPTFLEVFMVNSLVFRWPKPIFFMVWGAHGSLWTSFTVNQNHVLVGFHTPGFWRYDWIPKTYRSNTVHLRSYDWKTRVWILEAPPPNKKIYCKNASHQKKLPYHGYNIYYLIYSHMFVQQKNTQTPVNKTSKSKLFGSFFRS